MVRGDLIVSFPATEAGVESENPIGPGIVVVMCADETGCETSEQFLQTTCGIRFLEKKRGSA